MNTNKRLKRLPSFNELTSNFSNSLQIDRSNQSYTNSTVTSAQQTPQLTQSQQFTHTPQELSNSAPPIPPQQPHFNQIKTVIQAPGQGQGLGPGPGPGHVPAPHHSPFNSQQYQPQFLFNNPQGQIAPNQQVINQRIPSNYSELTRFQFPSPDPNYVISPTSVEESTSGQISTNIDPKRRYSMQLPPYPSHHSKKDSYDSQTSLSALADVASIGGEEENSQKNDENINKEYEDLTKLLHLIEKSLDKYKSLNQIFNDINYDFSLQLENSIKDQNFINDQNSIKLLLDYTSSNNELINSISIVFLKKFISNIPLSALKASINMNDEIRKGLESWLIYKEREVDDESSKMDIDKKSDVSQPIISQKFSSRPQSQSQSQSQSKLKSQSRSQSRSQSFITPNFLKNHSRQNSRGKNLRHYRHQSISVPPSQQIIKKSINNNPPPQSSSSSSSVQSIEISKNQDENIGSFSKKRKSSNTIINKNLNSINNIKNDENNISLIVKPPKPVIDSSITQPPPIKGVFNEDLSIKTDHKCQQCGSDDTPEWRRGPYGSRSLCNACGLFYGKLIKKFGYDEAAVIMLKRKDQGNGDDRRIPID